MTRTKLVMVPITANEQSSRLTAAFDKKMAEALHLEPTPDHIAFSSAQNAAAGGQFGHVAALLIWND